MASIILLLLSILLFFLHFAGILSYLFDAISYSLSVILCTMLTYICRRYSVQKPRRLISSIITSIGVRIVSFDWWPGHSQTKVNRNGVCSGFSGKHCTDFHRQASDQLRYECFTNSSFSGHRNPSSVRPTKN